MGISAVSGATAAASDDVVWRLDPGVPIADQLREDFRTGGTVGALSFIENTSSPHGKILDYAAGAGTAGKITYVLRDTDGSDLAIPEDADGYMRYIAEIRYGPQGAGAILPSFSYLYQNENRHLVIGRGGGGSSGKLNMSGYNDNAVNFFDVLAGPNITNTTPGGWCQLICQLRKPSGANPGGRILQKTATPTTQQERDVTGGYSGTAPPNSDGAWGAGWGTDGTAKLAISIFVTGAAGSAWIQGLSIKRHPLSNG